MRKTSEEFNSPIVIENIGCLCGEELEGNYIFKVHHRGKPEEYKKYAYDALEAKLVLGNNIVVSIMTEFVENTDEETKKQDCERKACQRLMKRLKETFPKLPICIGADSLTQH